MVYTVQDGLVNREVWEHLYSIAVLNLILYPRVSGSVIHMESLDRKPSGRAWHRVHHLCKGALYVWFLHPALEQDCARKTMWLGGARVGTDAPHDGSMLTLKLCTAKVSLNLALAALDLPAETATKTGRRTY